MTCEFTVRHSHSAAVVVIGHVTTEGFTEKNREDESSHGILD